MGSVKQRKDDGRWFIQWIDGTGKQRQKTVLRSNGLSVSCSQALCVPSSITRCFRPGIIFRNEINALLEVSTTSCFRRLPVELITAQVVLSACTSRAIYRRVGVLLLLSDWFGLQINRRLRRGGTPVSSPVRAPVLCTAPSSMPMPRCRRSPSSTVTLL
jgi:hypothetical protein